MTDINENVATTKSNRPCSGIKNDLVECLMSSDCFRIEKKSAKECLLSGNISQECYSLRILYFECKRSLLDNRQRFRGRKGY